jgi:hypothetical protein
MNRFFFCYSASDVAWVSMCACQLHAAFADLYICLGLFNFIKFNSTSLTLSCHNLASELLKLATAALVK